MDQRMVCNGVLISDQSVITSSICSVDDPKLYKIYLGIYDLELMDQIPGFKVTKIIFSDTIDITILMLNMRVIFNDFVQPICLYNKEIKFESTGFVAGYQKIELGFGNIPLAMTLSISEYEKCAENSYESNSSFKFCAFPLYTTQCVADFGTGFYTVHENVFYLRGTLSFWMHGPIEAHRFLCDKAHNLIFNNITRHQGWISKILRENSNEEKESIEIKRERINKTNKNYKFESFKEGCLYANETMISPMACTIMKIHINGSLVVYRNRKPYISYWSSDTDGKDAEKACLLPNGNFVIFNHKNKIIWSTDTFGRNFTVKLVDLGRFYVDNDGNSVFISNPIIPC